MTRGILAVLLVTLAVLLLVGGTAAPALAGESTLRFSRDYDNPNPMTEAGALVWQRWLDPVAADTNRIHSLYVAPVTGDTTYTFTDAENDSIDYARNLTVTISADPDSNIAQGTITIYGTNLLGQAIHEEFAVTDSTAETVTGSSAFASVTSIVIPQMDGAGVHVSVGVGFKLGLKATTFGDTVLLYFADGTAPATHTGAWSGTAIESCTLYSGDAYPDGSTTFDVLYVVPPYSGTTNFDKW